MTTFTYHRPGTRTQQDHNEMHVWGKKEYPEVGSIIKVKGTDTEDEEAEVLNIGGVDFKLRDDSDAEVFLISSSSDTMHKQAVQTIPKDKQRRWREGHGGIQFVLDPEFALDFREDLAHITKHFFAVGKDGEFEIKKKDGFLRLDKVIITGELYVNKRVWSPEYLNGSQEPPGFKGNDQEPKKAGGGGSSGGSSGTAITAGFWDGIESPVV